MVFVLALVSVIAVILMVESLHKPGKITSKIFGTVFSVYAIIGSVITDRVFLSLIISLSATSLLTIPAFLIQPAVKHLQSKTKMRDVILLLLVGALIVAIVIGALIALFPSISATQSPRCINCGKHAMYTETGFCYTCYNEVKKLVIEGMP